MGVIRAYTLVSTHVTSKRTVQRALKGLIEASLTAVIRFIYQGKK